MAIAIELGTVTSQIYTAMCMDWKLTQCHACIHPSHLQGLCIANKEICGYYTKLTLAEKSE